MKAGHLDIRVDQEIIDKIDEWRLAQPISPSRAATIGYILQKWCEDGENAKRPRPLRPR
jgi:hypothetical protein